MFKSYIKIAWRNLLRSKGYTLINILGLSIGLSSCILIMLFIKDELSYDNFRTNRDCIYRIVEESTINGQSRYSPGTPAPLASALRTEFPEVLQTTRIGARQGDVITHGDIQTRGNHLALADPNVFDVFSIPLTSGNARSALDDLYSVVISERIAQKYFGDKDPVGEILQIGHESYQKDYKVTGVFKDIPSNSILKFDCLASFQHVYMKGNEGNLTWGARNYSTFVLLQEDYASKNLESKLPLIVEKFIDDEHQSAPQESKIEYLLQPLTDIHLSLDPGNKLPTERDSVYVFLFAGVAILILLIACINFMNLATARASMREKEVGVRKVVGANRLHLVQQFLGESIILSLLACVLSIPVVEGFLPAFNRYADKQLSFLHHENIPFLVCLPVLALIVGVLAGSYPALFISSFKPATILRGRLFYGRIKTTIGLRRILVVSQFVISIIFVAITLVIHNQMHYIKNKNLGYDKDHLVVIPIYDQHVKPKYELYKTEVLRSPNILSATASSYLPSEPGYYQNIYFKGQTGSTLSHINWISVDHDFIGAMGLELIRGSNFSQDSPDDAVKYILNESAVNQIAWENPLGQQINIIGWGPVVGVIKDFHFQSLHYQIRPMVLCVYPEGFQYLLVKVKPENISDSIRFLESQWKEIFPDQIFEYGFFDESFERLYKTEIRSGNIFNFVTAMALLLACLGLFGLVHFSTERRTKEIGIRKALGSTVLNIVTLLTKDLIKWVVLANIIGWPIAYYVMYEWLQNFAYRIDMSWWMFASAGAIALTIALLTVGGQAIRAATANPVEALRYE